MQISGMPNKFEIFQEFYYMQNGVEISYREALRLFYEMDNDTLANFEKYCQDEVGYEIIAPKGFNLDSNITVKTYNDGGVDKVVRVNGKVVKVKTITNSDGTLTTVEGCVSQSTKNAINTKYTLDAYAKKNGLVLDEQWAVYSAEEIIQMADGGVNIPQEVIDIANTVLQTQAATQIASESEDTEDAEKDSFINLIPKAQKKIKKCNETNEKIDDKVEDLLPQQNKRNKKLAAKMKEQKRSLREFENFVREWNKIQTKINNGEPLSKSEARRYAQLTGMFEEKKSGSENNNFSIDKREIARAMNELNILSILGEQLAEETIEIGDTLADYTSKANYKATRKEVMGQTGLLHAIALMATGKSLAKEAVVTGNDAKEYTEETQKSVNNIAQVLDIENQIAGKDAILGTEQPKAEAADSAEAVENAEEQPAQETQSAQGEDKNPEITEQEDFVINDKNVKELIKEASDINVDLLKQTVSAIKSIKVAKNDKKFAKIAGFKVTKLVNEFQKKEEQRQARIQEMEQENKEANQELENLTGKSADELNKQQPTEKADKETKNEQTDNKTDNVKVAELRQKIASNNEEITNIKSESEDAKDKFKNSTAKESEIISEAIPAQAEALKKDTQYKEEVIPAAKERLNFTDASGETLSKIGMYRVELGMMQIMALQLEKGLRNIVLGTISTGIGLVAQAEGDSPLPSIAEKATGKSVKEEDNALNSLTSLEAQIISVTGEDATVIPADEEENAEGAQGTENEEEVDPPPTTEDTNSSVVEEEVVTEAQETAEDTGVETAAVPAEENSTDAVEETEDAQNTEVTEGTGKKEEKEEDPDAVKASGDKQEGAADKQQDIVDDAADSATDDGKDSEKIRKNTEKDEKQLAKEAKRLEKQIQKEQEEVIKLNEESLRAVEKQEVLLVEYETLSAESEQVAAEEEAKQMNQPNQQPAQQEGGQGGVLASNSFTITSSGGSDNQGKLDQNSQRINELGIEFKSQDRIVVRNRKKITKIEKSIKTKTKKFEKTTKLRTKKLKETEKQEKDKQKRLAKQLAIVGIAENVFSITSSVGTILSTAGKICISTGTPMLSNPFTAAAGAALVSTGATLEVKGELLTTIGTYGTVACGVTKGIINIANGNLAAGLMAIGSAAISAVTAATGTGGASSSALNFVTAGLQIVSSSAEMVNNVRAVQGKEASGIASKIGTIAGVGSAVTGAASSVSNMGGQNTLGKIATITSATGTALSSTSQIMTEFGGDEKTASILGTIGGGMQTLGSIGQLANSAANKNKEDTDNNSEDNKDKTKNTNKNNNETTVKDGKLIGPDGKEVKLPEGCKIKGNEVIDANGNKVKVGTDGKIKTNTQNTNNNQTAENGNKATVKDGRIIGPDGKEVKLPAGYKVSGDKIIGPNGKEVKLDSNGKVLKADHQQQLKEAKDAKERQKGLAKKTDDKNKKQEILNGSSEYYSDKNNDQLQGELTKIQKEDAKKFTTSIGASKLQGELDSRQQYKDQMAFLNADKQAKMDKIGQIIDIAGQTANSTMQVAGMFMSQNQEGETKKKAAAPGKLTARTKEIMRKNELYRRRRVQALAKSQRYYA